MHRRKLLDLLESYKTSGRMTSVELDSFQRLVAFVKRRPDCFERSLKEGHITGSAWLLNHELDACLLTHHRKLKLWLQPGGHADGESDVLKVALKEAREESGILGIEPLSEEIFDVDVHQIPARASEPAHLHYDVRFVLRAPLGATYVVSEESLDLAWVQRKAVASFATDDSVLRMTDKWTFVR